MLQNQQNNGGGGVAMQLDYDINIMSEFCSWVVFSLFKCTNNMASPHFQSLLNSVLTATRLPKSTVLLGVHYVSRKLEIENEPCFNESKIFETLIMGLLLANKFNDDNTFKNRSWADATGLNLEKINQLERDWLKGCLWRLYDDSQYNLVESCWLTWCMRFDNHFNNSIDDISHSPLYYNNNDDCGSRSFSMNSNVNTSPSSCYYMNPAQPQPVYGYNYGYNYGYYVAPQTLPVPIQQIPLQLPNIHQHHQKQQQQQQQPPYFNYYGYAAVY